MMRDVLCIDNVVHCHNMAGNPNKQRVAHVDRPFLSVTLARRGRISDATLEAPTRRGQEAAGVAKSCVDSSSFAVHALRGMIPFRRGTKPTHGTIVG